jgi:glycogen debranching enzyme
MACTCLRVIPFIVEGQEDWLPRYAIYNRPGEYHNGGIWPFTVGFYIAALVAAGRNELAEEKMASFSELAQRAHSEQLDYGFNEWFRAQDCSARGQDWQTRSAAMNLYAAE